jgi:hypothetical protein
LERISITARAERQADQGTEILFLE